MRFHWNYQQLEVYYYCDQIATHDYEIINIRVQTEGKNYFKMALGDFVKAMAFIFWSLWLLAILLDSCCWSALKKLVAVFAWAFGSLEDFLSWIVLSEVGLDDDEAAALWKPSLWLIGFPFLIGVFSTDWGRRVNCLTSVLLFFLYKLDLDFSLFHKNTSLFWESSLLGLVLTGPLK